MFGVPLPCVSMKRQINKLRIAEQKSRKTFALSIVKQYNISLLKQCAAHGNNSNKYQRLKYYLINIQYMPEFLQYSSVT